MKIKIKRFDKKIPLPKYEKLAAGFDFVCRKGATIKQKEIKAIPSNVACEIPDGYVLFAVPRSSTAKRFGLLMPHSFGVVDPFYRGDDNEIILLFYNFTGHSVKIKKGDKIAQGILIKFEKVEFIEVNKLNKSSRKKWDVKTKKYAKRN